MAIKVLKEGYYLIDWRDSDHKRHRKTVHGTKKYAQLVEAKLKQEREDELLFPEKKDIKVRFDTLIAFYWRMHSCQLRSQDWKYKKRKLEERFGSLSMQELTSSVLQSFYNEMREKGRTAATARRYITFINAIINFAIKHQRYRGRNPCTALTMEPEDNKRTRYLTQKEVEIVLKACRKDVRQVVFCALYTGMRRGEILSLCWENVDMVHDNITLLHTKSSKKREIPILPELKKLFLEIGPQKSGPVFSISKDAFICSFKRMAAKLPIADFHFHDLRHTFASFFMMGGGSITDLQQILGHSDLKLTQRYAHLSPEHLKKGMRVMQGVFGDFTGK